MAFVMFTMNGRVFTPTASIRKSGNIGINMHTVNKYGLKDGYAEMYYDDENRLIGIKPVDKSADHAMKMTVTGRDGFICAKRFLGYFEIPRDKATKYHAFWDEELQMLIIDLNRSL